ncbi:hypothetical protein [uncultured Azohydromonas sp.]|mgnify:CR=1 FL=1|jgi:hypothetical protein|uniref:hypothetical protein n=1 Tax=uncultured Azohydromonas sp. TaxID=487342 RepID=UPI00262B0652|nr:hypothetical protein [uncultured Azohydromonas sp.]
MDQDKAHDFWQIVVDGAATLCELLDASPAEHGLQDGLQRIGRVVQTLRDAAADIDPLLTVEVDQVPACDSAVLRIAISCNHDPDGIEAVQALVAVAPAMPPRIQVCAFAPPAPKEMASELASLEILGQEIPVQQVRFMAEPSTNVPGTFDVACFVPSSAVTEMDQGLPGALVADVLLNMGIGELRVMTRVSRIGIAVTNHPPPKAIQAWDLAEIIDSAPAH